jgi:Uncharacterized conserved protein
MKRSGSNDQVVTAHAVLLGDRINTSGIEGETLSTSPLAIRIDKGGIAVLFRYGVVVMIGLSQQQEQELLEKLSARVSGRLDRYEEETAVIKLADEDEDQVPAGGPILVGRCLQRGCWLLPTFWPRASCWHMTSDGSPKFLR